MTASDIPIIAIAAATDSSDFQLTKSMGLLTEVRKRIDLPVVSGETLCVLPIQRKTISSH